ncbi:MAG: alcohol dehydrogenase catalytic domain-containing protein, partial [Verrucomicrobia bacterium]|nr:alcohol dehydrogenase catalytic domain-containing protein [Verrucomicrobiota bacterium]
MKAMALDRPGAPLRAMELPRPEPGPGQVRLKVLACGVCRTDLHIVDGDLPFPGGPLVPGHEIVGEVEAIGPGVKSFRPGQRAGAPWLGWTCGRCAYCREGMDNLCDEARFTGYTLPGGYAEEIAVDARYCFPIGGPWSAQEAAPLLCAGLMGYRRLGWAGEGRGRGF